MSQRSGDSPSGSSRKGLLVDYGEEGDEDIDGAPMQDESSMDNYNYNSSSASYGRVSSVGGVDDENSLDRRSKLREIENR